MSPGVVTMARRKVENSTPPAEEKAERETVIHMKGSPEYVQWLESVHKKTRIPKVQIFRMAIEEWSQRHGHPAPPEI